MSSFFALYHYYKLFVSHCNYKVVSKVVASVLFDVALSKHRYIYGPRDGHDICKFLASNPTLVAAASLNSGQLSPSLGHTRGPVKEILSLAGPILAKFHLEGSWVVFWSHKHSSLSLSPLAPSSFLAKNFSTGPAPCFISLISGKIVYILSKN